MPNSLPTLIQKEGREIGPKLANVSAQAPERDSGTVHVMSQKRLRVRAYALRYLRTNLSLNADVSENTLPFVSQSINNFSDYDVSQSHDWECPSLSPHVPLEITGEAATVLGVKLGRVPVLIQLVERLPNIASN